METYQLTLNNILKYVKEIYSDVEVVYRPPHGNDIRSTYGREYERVLKLADGLNKLGVGPGDRVATLDWNTIWHFELYWAVPGMGAVLHPLNVRLAPEDLVYIINHAGDKVLIYHRDFAPLVEKLKPHLKTVQLYIQIADGQGPATKDVEIEDVIKQGEPKPLPEISEDKVATIGYTSGTTGRPKGAYFTHRALTLHTLVSALAFAGFRGFARPECVEEICTFLQLVPMFHVHGWGTPWTFALLGWRQVYPGRFDAGHTARLIAEENVKSLAGVPTMLYMILTHPDFPKYVEKVRKIRPIFTVGGAALPKELAKKAEEAGFIPRVGYGMTETAPILTLGFFKPTEKIPKDVEEYYHLLTATGLPIPLVDLMVADENLRPVPRDGKTMGEIVVRAPWVTPEYLGDPEKTREAWRGGWFHTGDVAIWQPDGRVRIVDRAKDVIKSGGEWISSLQLEDLILTHPAVAQAAVIGVPHEMWGERPVAVVILKPGASAKEEDIIKHLEKFVEAGKIPKWWLPDKVIFVQQLPLTGTGKIDKKVLREQFKDVLKK
ncbi:long-chain-fatty-acid--CoA ligase [Pyrobaculum calidifontis]|uniref:AMP-dependent synthetase and ligase n=1 Tax=Pyrobaculum calidifontis (strain DSM 21063 / JCM 11548 / VA1) TaxID=410359 RepID=A3MWS3_PYRCJ|nr:long-chain-fatty-acid--CoA ligase [Pyrobaculum calidifontis]ABO09090.1 AMP-dependent synthetase and ligase [Pyrobaculum calidifontis JCM 11548]